MSNAELVPVPSDCPVREVASTSPTRALNLVEHWLSGLCERTRKGYRSDLEDFARSTGHADYGHADYGHALAALFALPAGDAHELILGYRNRLLAAGKATATVARHMAALRSVVELAHSLGRVGWVLKIRSPKVEPRRDVRGPDAHDRKKVWKALKADTRAKGLRDRAIVALLFDLALRRNEAASLDLEHVDLGDGSLAILRKGHRERVRRTMPPATRDVVAAWIAARGPVPGPLFVAFRKGGHATDNRISGDSIADVCKALGERAKLPRRLRPHGFRHAAITAAAEAGVDSRSLREFSGHARMETVERYIDSTKDRAGEVAGIVSRERR